MATIESWWRPGRTVVGCDANARVGLPPEHLLVGSDALGEPNDRGWRLRWSVSKLHGLFLNTYDQLQPAHTWIPRKAGAQPLQIDYIIVPSELKRWSTAV
eukprot:4825164-Alexandrium_andersonii.AAC.1